MKCLIIILSFLIAGCGSTPYRDDYAKHVNLMKSSYFSESNFKFSFVENPNVDLRGQYSRNDTADASPILYQGGAGLAGLLVQIGTHSTMVNAQRSEKLAMAQEQANQPVQPLINITKDIELVDLIDEHKLQWVNPDDIDEKILHIKPIFFSNKDMTELSIKAVVWLPKQNKKSRKKQKFNYKNMIHIYGEKFDKVQQQKLIDGDEEFLKLQLSTLLKTAINIAKDDLTGSYAKKKSRTKTFFINNDSGKKVFRGAIVAEKCGYKVIQDLHSWFIALPLKKAENSIDNDTIHQC